MNDRSKFESDSDNSKNVCTAFSRSSKMRTHDSLVIDEALPLPAVAQLSSPTAFLFTSESVGEGQSDKLCDQVGKQSSKTFGPFTPLIMVPSKYRSATSNMI